MRKRSQRIEAFYISGDLLAKVDMWRHGQKLRTGKLKTYSGTVQELLSIAVEDLASMPKDSSNPLPEILARLARIESVLKLTEG